MEGIEFDLALKDEMSGHASDAKKALVALGDTAKSAGGAVDQLGKHFKDAGEHAKESKGFVEEFTKSLIPQIALGELAAEGMKKLGESIVEGVKFAVEAAEFKENMVDAYAIVRGGVEEGERTFREIDTLAKGLHMPTEKAHELAQSLMLQGLTNQKELTSTIEAVSNLQRVGMAAGADHLKSAIERSLASGHFEITSKQLRGTGTNVDQVYAALADRLHVSTADIKQEMADGKISVDDGVTAITDAINNSNVAELAKKKFTITDALTDIKNSVRGLFQEADAGPLVEAFRGIAESIKPGTDGAREFKETLNSIISVAADLVDAMKTVGHAAKSAFDYVTDLFRTDENYAASHLTHEQQAQINEYNRKANDKKAALKDLQDKSDEFDSRWNRKESEARVSHGGGGGGGGGHVSARDKFDPELLGRSGGIGAEGAMQWGDMLKAMGLEHGATSADGAAAAIAARAGAGANAKIGSVNVGGMTVQIHGVANAEEILSLLPSAMVDMLEQASNEAGA